MKFAETVATEQELLKQRVRLLQLINGYLSVTWFVILAYTAYSVIRAVI